MIDYKTDTRQAHSEGGDASSQAANAEELLKERRAYYYNLVDQVFGTEPKNREKSRKELEGLSVYDLMAMYAAMRTSREIDHMQGLLQRTGNLWFSIAGAGKEVINIAIAHHMRPDDAKLPYYRDQTLALWSGIRMLDITRQSVASRFDPMSGGRQMSSHFGSVEFNFPTGSTMTGSQFLPAAGYGEGLKLERKLGKKHSRGAKIGRDDSFVYTSIGDGTTSEGEVEEAIRDAVRYMAPVLFVVEDDEWAISTPVSVNIPGGNAAKLYSRYSHIGPDNHLEVVEIDGTDFFESFRTAKKITDYLRSGKGPVLLHAHVTRPLSHSSADSQSNYRSVEDINSESLRDPLAKMKVILADNGVDEEKLKALDALVIGEIRKASEQAVAEPKLDPETIKWHVTSTPYDLRVSRFSEGAANQL
ncbi:MAG: thiamine pyrophosphate-dependent dehydrogenase E1 component subunit alpha, partial [Chloroflexia bacterium]